MLFRTMMKLKMMPKMMSKMMPKMIPKMMTKMMLINQKKKQLKSKNLANYTIIKNSSMKLKSKALR